MAKKKVEFTVARDGFVNIEHKGTKGKARCRPEALSVWLDKGWSLSDAEKKSEPAAATVVVGDEEEK